MGNFGELILLAPGLLKAHPSKNNHLFWDVFAELGSKIAKVFTDAGQRELLVYWVANVLMISKGNTSTMGEQSVNRWLKMLIKDTGMTATLNDLLGRKIISIDEKNALLNF